MRVLAFRSVFVAAALLTASLTVGCKKEGSGDKPTTKAATPAAKAPGTPKATTPKAAPKADPVAAARAAAAKIKTVSLPASHFGLRLPVGDRVKVSKMSFRGGSKSITHQYRESEPWTQVKTLILADGWKITEEKERPMRKMYRIEKGGNKLRVELTDMSSLASAKVPWKTFVSVYN